MNVDIVNLIESNPITKLDGNYQSKLIEKIKNNFNNYEQQMFLASFYCYLNYDSKNDFVIDLDNIWKWLDFKQKVNAKNLLEKNFIENIDYKKLLLLQQKQNTNRGGHNKETFLLSIRTFKKFCLKAGTKKADEIHEYFIKLEEILQEIIKEESNELKIQLEKKENTIQEKENTILEKENTILEIKETSKNQKQKGVEQAIISQFPVNTECIYFGKIDNTNDQNEKLIKFGHTNDLATRVSYHRQKYDNFVLINAFRVQNKVEIENLIKKHNKIKMQIRTIKVNDKNKTEIICYDDTNFNIEKLTKYIKDIIHTKIYSMDNFSKLMKRNDELEERYIDLETKNIDLEKKNIELEKNITEKNIELINLKEKIMNLEKIIESVNNENQSVYKNVLLPEDDINKKFNEFVNEICIVRPDVEEFSVNIEGRYRLWNNVKPTKEIFHQLKSYLDTRFKPKRIEGQHGYIGIKLKSVEYKKRFENSTIETFIFQVCKFSDNGKILNSVLLKEYQQWKLSINKEINNNEMKEIKDYLNSCPYALKATVWSQDGSNEGYYGLSLKNNDLKPKLTSSTGKQVYKRHCETKELLGTWETIAKAADLEGISRPKMSRCVKDKVIINDYYYDTI